MSGARFALLLGAGARLSRALTDFMLDVRTLRNKIRQYSAEGIDVPAHTD